MGGNAIQNVRRVDAAEYFALVERVTARLRTALPGTRLEVIPAYRAKPDFGDMDILIERNALPSDWPQRVAAALDSREVVPNGPVCSFEFDGFQVDLITAQAAWFEFALGYFSWNDLGNLIGRIAHKHGFKFGHDGLHYPLRDGDHLVAEVLVTQDFAQALTFLGLNPVRVVEGFDTLEDMFAYVASSRYFDPAQFPLEHRSHRARTRDAKRPTYTAFLAWVNGRTLPVREAPSREARLAAASQAFPGFGERLTAARAALARQRAARERFNGRLVSDWTGLRGPALGAFIAQLKRDAGGPEALQAKVLESTPEALRDWVETMLRQPAVITSADEHRATLREVETLMRDDPAPGTPAGARLDALVTQVEDYERENFPIFGLAP